jgi:hypothetical protein
MTNMTGHQHMETNLERFSGDPYNPAPMIGKKKPPELLKGNLIQFRLTEEQYRVVTEAARADDSTVTTWVRSLVIKVARRAPAAGARSMKKHGPGSAVNAKGPVAAGLAARQ